MIATKTEVVAYDDVKIETYVDGKGAHPGHHPFLCDVTAAKITTPLRRKS